VNPFVKALRDFTSLDSPEDQSGYLTAAEMALGFVPGVGQAMAARDLERARRDKDPVGGALAAASFVPFTRLLRGGKETVSKMVGGKTGFKEEQAIRKQVEAALNRGEDPKELFEKTKWYREPGEPVMKRHFSDKPMNLHPWADRDLAFGIKDEPISQYIKHPELFNRYPDLADLKLTGTIDPMIPGQKGAFYSGPGELHVEAYTPKDFLSIVGHELQHGISSIEPGFSRGSNTAEGAQRLIAKDPNWERDSGKQREALIEYLRNRGEVEARGVERGIANRDFDKFPLEDIDWERMQLYPGEWDKLWFK
jgi:hypothetical protein